MKNTWAAGALGTPPPAPSSPSTGYPTDGDPLSSIQPTYPGAYWFHQVTMEIVNAITAAGLTPSATTLTQLTSAIQALAALAAPVQSVNGSTGAVTGLVATSSFTGGNQSLAASGYQKFPGGLIVQWGKVTTTNGNFSFPITFPNAALQVWASNTDAQGANNDNAYASVVSTSQFFLATKSATGGTTSFPCAWLAIGW